MTDSNHDKPDIIITDADLDAAEKSLKAAEDFFANPQPRPVKPNALVDVLCTKTKRKFAAYFEQDKPRSWILVEFIDDSIIGSPQVGRTVTIQPDLVKGNVDWSSIGTKLRCPYCQAKSLVKCGRCGKLSCHPDGQQGSSFHCPLCGEKGKLSGFIQAMDGSSGKKR